jgi:hypothetical protein
MEKLNIQLAGPETPCDRCKKTRKIIEEVLQKTGYSASIDHIVLTEKNTIEKYGVLKGPAVIINEVIVSEGEVPTPKHIEGVLKQILAS